MKPVTVKWLKYLVAILIGQVLYFCLLYPYLPPAAQHHPFKLDLGTLVDFWLCLVVYGLLELGAFLHKKGER
jgi:H+/gluconate symporter-like permease